MARCNVLPKHVINITQSPDWKWAPVDIAEEATELASQQPWPWEDVGSVEGLLTDLFTRVRAEESPRKRWQPFPKERTEITPDELEEAAKLVVERVPEVESIVFLIHDAVQFAYEEALMPGDDDIRYSIESAQERAYPDYELLEDEDWEKLEELLGFASDVLIFELVNSVRYERVPESRDRFLILGFSKERHFYQALQKALWELEPGKRQEVFELLGYLLNSFSDLFPNAFFEELEKVMENIDIGNRTNFEGQWKWQLKNANVPELRKEIYSALEEARETPR